MEEIGRNQEGDRKIRKKRKNRKTKGRVEIKRDKKLLFWNVAGLER